MKTDRAAPRRVILVTQDETAEKYPWVKQATDAEPASKKQADALLKAA